jgi:hypothetical protein
MNFETAKLELETSYKNHIDCEILMEREVLTQKFSHHLSLILDLDKEEISQRLRAPFEEEHIVINKESHQKMIDLVEGAFTDVLKSRDDVDLARWSHTAITPVKPLVKTADILELILARDPSPILAHFVNLRSSACM